MPNEPYFVHGLEWQKQEEYEKYSIEPLAKLLDSISLKWNRWHDLPFFLSQWRSF